MSFLFPRVVAITRPASDAAVGRQPYAGVTQANETPIVAGLAANIAVASGGARNQSGLPASAPRTSWYIFIPVMTGITLGTINVDDIVTDDAGERYQVVANFWTPLGYRLTADKLEA